MQPLCRYVYVLRWLAISAKLVVTCRYCIRSTTYCIGKHYSNILFKYIPVFLVVITTCVDIGYSIPGRHYNSDIGKYSIRYWSSLQHVLLASTVFLVVITTCSRHWQVQYSWSSLQHFLDIDKYSIPGRHYNMFYTIFLVITNVLDIGKYSTGVIG